jgi:hypothetical protein
MADLSCLGCVDTGVVSRQATSYPLNLAYLSA